MADNNKMAVRLKLDKEEMVFLLTPQQEAKVRQELEQVLASSSNLYNSIGIVWNLELIAKDREGNNCPIVCGTTEMRRIVAEDTIQIVEGKLTADLFCADGP